MTDTGTLEQQAALLRELYITVYALRHEVNKELARLHAKGMTYRELVPFLENVPGYRGYGGIRLGVQRGRGHLPVQVP